MENDTVILETSLEVSQTFKYTKYTLTKWPTISLLHIYPRGIKIYVHPKFVYEDL